MVAAAPRRAVFGRAAGSEVEKQTSADDEVIFERVKINKTRHAKCKLIYCGQD